MAHVELDENSQRYRIRFRYGGTEYKRSLKTTSETEANSVLGRVEETIRLLERGRLEMPPDADAGTFIVSDGKLVSKPTRPPILTLKDLLEGYHASLPEGAKAESTIGGEKIHQQHLLRHLGATTIANNIGGSQVQDYVRKRLRDKHHGKPIGPATVKKELTTLRLIWNWGVVQGCLSGPSPTKGVKLPRRAEKPPFRTRDEIQRIIDRGGLEEAEQKALWASMFLTATEIQEVLAHVKQAARYPFVYPMFVFVAHTGARRSEIQRSQVDDFDFSAGVVGIREKKKDHAKTVTFRRVPMTELLSKTMTEWFSQHPGGQYTICELLHTPRGKSRTDFVPLTSSEATHFFKDTLAGSKWDKIRGFHTFRHSFASNLAAGNTDQRLIDEWMGHQTEEMRKRYRHLFPDQQRKAIDSVFGGNGK